MSGISLVVETRDIAQVPDGRHCWSAIVQLFNNGQPSMRWGKPNMHNWAVVALEFKMLLLMRCLFSRDFGILFAAINLASFNG